jgi:hypothetical protein
MSDAKLGSGEPQTIEELKARYDRLFREKTQADTELAVAVSKLENAKEAAKRAYGTDDISELEKMLEEWTAENERLRREYETSLDNIESQLAAVQAETEKEE